MIARPYFVPTTFQHRMMRQACGLNSHNRSPWRNRYMACHHERAAWDELVVEGLAEKVTGGSGLREYRLTERGIQWARAKSK